MPEPVTVWMVKLRRGGDLREVQGTLRMDGDAVVFVDAATETETRLSFQATRKVRRVVGSPVLVITCRDDGSETSETAFYFAQPPSLEADFTAPANVLRKPSRRRQRRQSIGYLTARSRRSKATIRTWTEEIRARSEASGRSDRA